MSDDSISIQWREIIIYFFQTKINKSSLAKTTQAIEKKIGESKTQTNSQKLKNILNAIENKKLELEKLKSNPEEIAEWFDTDIVKNIDMGKKIIKVSHVLRMTNSLASNDGILIDGEDEYPLLTTASIPSKNKILDMAHNNGALVSISRFLALSCDGSSIYSLIDNNDFRFLESFSADKSQLERWKENFKNLIEKRNIHSATFTKQIFFPINEKEYHLLAILPSSTLIHSIYNRVTDIKYQKKIEFFNIDGCIKPKLVIPRNKNAIIRLGGNQPQNVSMLNKANKWKTDDKSKNTYGVFHVFSTEPPIWHSQIKPPIYKTSFFYELSNNREIAEIVQFLADFLARFESLQLSIKDPKRLKWIEDWLENITDEIMVYVKTIQNLSAGWSATQGIRLKVEHQVLLDFHRQDDEFKTIQHNIDWQTTIVKDFAAWLNVQLHKANQKFTPQDSHTKLWSKLFENNLREFFDMEHVSQQENVE